MEAVLSEEEKQILLQQAREALEASSRNRDLPILDLSTLPPRLCTKGASFVTLTREGELRGCIGTLKHDLPLVEDVRQHTVAAAQRDYRFSPIKKEEVDEIEIEISVLTPPEPLQYSHGEKLPDLLRPGIDGVILNHGTHRATFLPQVWVKIPQSKRFLEMLCEKALLPPDAWREGNLEILTYQVDAFHDIAPGNRLA